MFHCYIGIALLCFCCYLHCVDEWQINCNLINSQLATKRRREKKTRGNIETSKKLVFCASHLNCVVIFRTKCFWKGNGESPLLSRQRNKATKAQVYSIEKILLSTKSMTSSFWKIIQFNRDRWIIAKKIIGTDDWFQILPFLKWIFYKGKKKWENNYTILTLID